ncbi:HNH endonuclease [Corynebacterium lactis]|uniref:Endonuclease n=1 Tax=Corynebacterium lactis RW2-5 TaxID=1408189 RepID=A0A0K2H0J3_9CORY|nr:endonuclease [Corynebacterium lactis RW2-5]
MAGWGSKSKGPRSRGAPARIRAVVLNRDGGQCQVRGPRCEVVAVEVDHIVPVFEGGTDDLCNLQAVCGQCHRRKTRQESTRARARRRAPVWQRPHPGIL